MTDEQRHATHLWVVQCIRQTTATFIAVVMALLLMYKTPEPYHTLILSGQGWVNELLDGHPEHTHCELGTTWDVFLELVSVLHSLGHDDSKYVQLEEQLAIFLSMSITGLTIWHTGKHFQHSNQTISKYFCHMLGIFSSEPFYTMYIKLPDANTPPLWRIHSNTKLWPFSQHALGALDGSHIVCAPWSHSHPPYRNQKGFMSQNCLFVCNLDLQFVSSYTGWEGSATDAQVLDAGLKVGLKILDGYHYLADVGFHSEVSLWDDIVCQQGQLSSSSAEDPLHPALHQ